MDLVILIAALVYVFGLLLHVTSIAAAALRICRPPPALHPAALTAVSVIRPLCGIDNHLVATLESSFRLAHPKFELLFCVASGSDPALKVVRDLLAKYPHVAARILIGNDALSANPKLNNVAKGWEAALYEWIVMADSNVLMPGDYLQRLLGKWGFDTGLVCSPPVGSSPVGIWAEIECAFLNTHQARWQSFADSVGLGFAQGKTMCWRRDVLDRAGGIASLGGELAEDAAATKLIRKAGLRVRLTDHMFDQPLGERTARDVWQRQLRWARLRRDAFKGWFIPELLTGLLPPLAAGTILFGSLDAPVVPILAGTALVWYGAEALLARLAGWHLSWRSPFLWALRDLLLPALWVAAWLGRDFVWRGNPMSIADTEAA